VSFICIILSLFSGIILGTLRFAKIPLISFIAGLFIDLTRAIPLILFIIFVHFSVSPYLFGYSAFLNYMGIDSLEMYSAIIALVIFNCAYIAEIIRSGLESVGKDQILAAQSLALSKVQVIEHIVLPQALRRIKPSLVAQLVTLVKDTSLASAIGLIELTRACEIVYETSYHEFEVLCFAACVYVSVNFLIQKMFNTDIKC
ncbi:MAG TPA: amino acid ABC transporter permease, partial [Candidatus Gastranaerophilaceae bacterium]|nr:amino acid ABC transporter permease [Candidatus Gastranaerophilaceae bacterium]